MEYIKKLDEGKFGSVWKVKKGDKIIALKEIKLIDEKMKKQALLEVKLLKEISDPCILSLSCIYDYYIKDNTLYIEMEYIDGVTLKDFAASFKGFPILYRHLLAIIKDIIPGIQYLHSKGIIHRDIKPENIMIDKNNQPKLIDIGLACKALYGGYENGGCDINTKPIECCFGTAGTPLFMAPETMLNNVSYFASDVFSLGASIYDSATGKDLYPGIRNYKELIHFVRKGDIPKLNTPNVQLNSLVNKMLTFSVLDRITTEQILEYLE